MPTNIPNIPDHNISEYQGSPPHWHFFGTFLALFFTFDPFALRPHGPRHLATPWIMPTNIPNIPDHNISEYQGSPPHWHFFGTFLALFFTFDPFALRPHGPRHLATPWIMPTNIPNIPDHNISEYQGSPPHWHFFGTFLALFFIFDLFALRRHGPRHLATP